MDWPKAPFWTSAAAETLRAQRSVLLRTGKVNEIKSGMMEEATKNARIAGEQFLHDSQTKPGKLNCAAQGWCQIENCDAATPERKVVRVVVDVEYEAN